MPEFISKLQYKTYEKGEYSDEKARDLDETLLLIKNFPWEEQRGADVQLTGPSVTILDEYGNYLKSGLYFNDKFCLYYLDCDDHLYEYHVSDLDDMCIIVSSFFDGQIDMTKFEKHLSSAGAKKHFESASFEFRVSAFSFYSRFIFSIILLMMMMIFGLAIVFSDASLFAKFMMAIFASAISFLIIFSLLMQVKYYVKSKNMLLGLSQGRQTFYFGNRDEVVNYNKPDIAVINIFGRFSSRGTPVLNVIEINFNNGSKIKLPGLLIDPMIILEKFANVEIKRFEKSGEIRRAMWDYAMRD